MRMWVEIAFSLVYLVVVYGLVIAMFRRREAVAPENRRVTGLVTAMFALLALGDTGHVGFRVVAYVLGGMQAEALETQATLVGLGALATAITVTIFYVLVLVMWQARFQKPYGLFGCVLFAAAIARLVIMAFPQNQWGSLVPPQLWSLYRNLPLMLQGLGVAYLILRDARAAEDRTFTWIGLMILVSYACYMPVIFLVQQMPIIGMLMIPKTIAYVAIAIIAYRGLYPQKERQLQTA
jgi:hypothetical protein